MRSLSSRLVENFKCKMHESGIEQCSVQKVLRLFGYTNSTNQQYICCLQLSPRIDIHKFCIGSQHFVMVIITNNDMVIDSAIWSVNVHCWDSLSNKTFANCLSIDDIDKQLQQFITGYISFVMRYCPSNL